MATAAAAQEIPSQLKLEKAPGLIPLPKAEVAKQSKEAHQLLIDAKPELRTQDEAAIKTYLTDVSEERAAGLSTLVVENERVLDKSQDDLREFIQSAGGQLTEAHLAEVEQRFNPYLVENLDYTIAITEGEIKKGNTNHQPLHDRAVTVRTQLENTTEVEISYGDVKEQPVTLVAWRAKLKGEAIKIWKIEVNPAATDDQFNNAEPFTQYAYMLKAKDKILKEKAGGKISVGFRNSEEPKTEKPDPNKTEAEKGEKVTEGMFFTGVNLAENLTKEIGIKVITRKDNKPDGEITGINQQALDEILKNPENNPANVHLARLVILIGQYQNISENPQMEQARYNVSTKIYHAIRDFKSIDQITDTTLKEKIVSIQNGDAEFMRRTEAEEKRLWKEYLSPLKLHPAEANIPVEQSFSYILSSSLFESAVVEVKNEHGQATGYKFTDEVEEMIKKLGYTPLQRQGILALAANKGESGRYLTNELGFDMEILTGKNMAEFYAKKAAEALESTAVKRGKTEYEKGKKDAFEEIFKKLLSDESLRKMVEGRGFPKGLTGILLIVALFLPAAQGLADSGVETGERSAGGG